MPGIHRGGSATRSRTPLHRVWAPPLGTRARVPRQGGAVSQRRSPAGTGVDSAPVDAARSAGDSASPLGGVPEGVPWGAAEEEPLNWTAENSRRLEDLLRRVVREELRRGEAAKRLPCPKCRSTQSCVVGPPMRGKKAGCLQCLDCHYWWSVPDLTPYLPERF